MKDEHVLSRLLDTVLDLPEEQRAGWIDALDDEHAALKPRLRALLARAASIETSDFLETLPKLDAPQSADAGDSIGPYRLIREIGAGGMGSVWLAERSDGVLKRPVALKCLRTVDARHAFAERLARERDILSGLVHPGIARLYDAGISSNGLPYIALEYIEGDHIDVYCRTRELGVRERVLLVLQVARAVAFAHGNLVVHRDLKPANVLVTPDGQTHLLDFGIAKLLDAGRAVETRLTQLGGKALTPEYASPEQIRGEAVTTATDVYSLGVILYELLADTRPYALKRESRGALEDAILEADPRPPSERMTGASLSPALLRDLDAVVLKALKKSPQERYATMDAFADDLQRFLEGRAVQAQPDSSGYRLRKWIGRHRLATAAAAAFVAVVVAGATISVWQARIAVAERQRAERVKEFIGSIFAEASPWTGPQDSPSAAALLVRARGRVDASADMDPLMRMELLAIIGESLEGIGESALAGEVAEQLVNTSAGTLASDHALTLRALRLRAEIARDRGDAAAMRRDLETVLAALRPQADRRAVETVGALKAFGEVQMDQSLYGEAERTAHEALALAARHRSEWTVRDWENAQAGLWELIATAQEARVEYGPALQSIDTALRHAETAYADQPKHPAVIDLRLLHARIAAYVDLPRAIVTMQRSIADTIEVFGDEHRSVGLYLQNLAVWQARSGDLMAARDSIDRALPILAKNFGADAVHVAAGLDAAAYIALNARQPQRAVDLYDRALSIAAKHLPEDSEHLAVMRMRRALARAHAGQAQEATTELRAVRDAFHSRGYAAPSRAYAALGEAQRLSGDYQDALATQQAGLGLVAAGPGADRERMGFLAEEGFNRLELQQFDEAVSTLQEALDLVQRQQPSPSPLRAELQLALARAYAATGQTDQAQSHLAAARTFWRTFDPGHPVAQVAAP